MIYYLYYNMNRNGYKWNINECLQLQREYELLKLTIDEIAVKHKRTPKAIMFKLDKEEFATLANLYNDYYGLNKFEINNYWGSTEHPFCQNLFTQDIDEDESEEDESEEDEEDEDESESEDESEEESKSSELDTRYIHHLETQILNILKYIKENIKINTFISNE